MDTFTEAQWKARKHDDPDALCGTCLRRAISPRVYGDERCCDTIHGPWLQPISAHSRQFRAFHGRKATRYMRGRFVALEP